MNRQQIIRERAYRIWEQEGCPEGREQDHWVRAEREIAFPEMAQDRAAGTGTEGESACASGDPAPTRAKRGRVEKSAVRARDGRAGAAIKKTRSKKTDTARA